MEKFVMIVAYSVDYLIMLIISSAQLWIHMSFFPVLIHIASFF